MLKPVLPDPGVPFQLVHHDDVATAHRAGGAGPRRPGVYNLAGDGRDHDERPRRRARLVLDPVPELAVDAAAELIARLPFLPPEAQWLEAFREPVLMDTAKAQRELGWRPKYTRRDTLEDRRGGPRAAALLAAV